MAKYTLRDVVIATAIAVAPLIIVKVMEDADFRQAVTMRAARMARTFCQAQADWWADMAARAATAYNRARL